MEHAQISSGALIAVRELNPSSKFFKEGVSLRITAKLQEFSIETAMAVVADGDKTLKIDTENLRGVSLRVGSIFQFIGELHIQPNNQAVLQARVGRNLDGIDLNLYHQSIQLIRQFIEER